MERERHQEEAQEIALEACLRGSHEHAQRRGSLRSWFQLSKPRRETILTLRWAYTPEEVAAQVISGFSELETWWDNKQDGSHIYITR